MEILIPFEEATDFVQVGCVPSAGYVLPCFRGLDHHVKNMVSKYHSGFVQGLKNSLQRCMPYYEENETYILDPHFKLRWCLNDAEKQKSIDLLKSALERIIPYSQLVNVASQASEDIEPSPIKK